MRYVSEVAPNPKCNNCLHYDPQRGSVGVCVLGLKPSGCGAGEAPRTGYAPMDHLMPDTQGDQAPHASVGMPSGDVFVIPVCELDKLEADLSKALKSNLKKASKNCVLHDQDLMKGGGGYTSLSLPVENMQCSCDTVDVSVVAKSWRAEQSNAQNRTLSDLELKYYATKLYKGGHIATTFHDLAMEWHNLAKSTSATEHHLIASKMAYFAAYDHKCDKQRDLMEKSLQLGRYHLQKALDAGVGVGQQSGFLMTVFGVRPSLRKAEQGEGSRGGHVIGHTARGNPIYDKNNPATRNTTLKDLKVGDAVHIGGVYHTVHDAAHFPDGTSKITTRSHLGHARTIHGKQTHTLEDLMDRADVGENPEITTKRGKRVTKLHDDEDKHVYPDKPKKLSDPDDEAPAVSEGDPNAAKPPADAEPKSKKEKAQKQSEVEGGDKKSPPKEDKASAKTAKINEAIDHGTKLFGSGQKDFQVMAALKKQFPDLSNKELERATRGAAAEHKIGGEAAKKKIYDDAVASVKKIMMAAGGMTMQQALEMAKKNNPNAPEKTLQSIVSGLWHTVDHKGHADKMTAASQTSSEKERQARNEATLDRMRSGQKDEKPPVEMTAKQQRKYDEQKNAYEAQEKQKQITSASSKKTTKMGVGIVKPIEISDKEFGNTGMSHDMASYFMEEMEKDKHKTFDQFVAKVMKPAWNDEEDGPYTPEKAKGRSLELLAEMKKQGHIDSYPGEEDAPKPKNVKLDHDTAFGKTTKKSPFKAGSDETFSVNNGVRISHDYADYIHEVMRSGEHKTVADLAEKILKPSWSKKNDGKYSKKKGESVIRSLLQTFQDHGYLGSGSASSSTKTSAKDSHPDALKQAVGLYSMSRASGSKDVGARKAAAEEMAREYVGKEFGSLSADDHQKMSEKHGENRSDPMSEILEGAHRFHAVKQRAASKKK